MGKIGDGRAESLFDAAAEQAARAAAPLAVRMRPRTLDEVIGQRHLTGPGTPFRKLIDHDENQRLNGCLVDTQRTTADLGAVEDQVVGVREGAGRLAGELVGHSGSGAVNG